MILSKLSDDIFLSMINIAGTHDSATAYVDFENQARCQRDTIESQLYLGVRLLDIRLALKKGRFFLVHSLANCYEDESKTKLLYFDEVLNICQQFLKENPTETILMSVKQDRGFQSKVFFQKFYLDYIKNKEKIWYLENEIPRLKDCRGKIVLLRRCKLSKSFLADYKCGLDFSCWKDQKKTRDKNPCKVILNDSSFAIVQDRYKLPPKEKWHSCAEKSLDCCRVSENIAAIHFLSTSSKGVTPFKASQYINELFMRYELPKDRAVGWIFTDFPDEALNRKIMLSNLKIYERDDIK